MAITERRSKTMKSILLGTVVMGIQHGSSARRMREISLIFPMRMPKPTDKVISGEEPAHRSGMASGADSNEIREKRADKEVSLGRGPVNGTRSTERAGRFQDRGSGCPDPQFRITGLRVLE